MPDVQDGALLRIVDPLLAMQLGIPSRESQMHMNDAMTLAEVGRANAALCARWVELSVRNFEHLHRLSLAAFEALFERPLASVQVAAVMAASEAVRNPGGEVTGPFARGADALGLPSLGMPGLVAEYAGDFSPDLRRERAG